MKRTSFLGVVSVVLLAACGGGGSGKGNSSSGEEGGTSATVPQPLTSTPLCLISADCPEGQHCDLGECIQDCNTEDPCTGELTCSPRARCLEEDQADEDVAATESLGTVSVYPTLLELSDAHNGKTITLTLESRSDTPIEYRVEIDAPYLSIEEPRGEFLKEGTIELTVDATKAQGRDSAGSVKIHTNMGEFIVSVPLKSGLNGRFQGAMRYDGGAVPLGAGRMTLELLADGTDLNVRVDPINSVLFPAPSATDATDDDATYGFGSIDSTTDPPKVEITLEQLVAPGLGGDRNHFERTIGRRVQLHLELDQSGQLTGTFDESIYGLFGQPVTITGTAQFDYLPAAELPDFTPLTTNRTMPTNAGDDYPASVGSLFQYDCSNTTGMYSSEYIITNTYEHLRTTLADATMPFSQIRENCEYALRLKTTSTDYSVVCGDAQPLACHLLLLSTGSTNDSNAVRSFATMLQGLVAQSSLVAQDYMVTALRSSLFDGSPRTELTHYDSALAAVSPVATLLLQPGVLEYVRQSSPGFAELEPLLIEHSTGLASSDLGPYPAARGLARILRLEADLDSERARTYSLLGEESISASLPDMQTRALLTYLESAVILNLLDTWGVTPSVVGSGFTGVLSSLDSAYSSLLDGGVSFGVPENYVPFVFRPEDAGQHPSNFEQKLAQASDRIGTYTTMVTDFETTSERLDSVEHQTQSQLADINSNYDTQIKLICGADFNLETPSTAIDWDTCGTTSGEAYELRLQVDSALLALQADESRLRGMGDKIKIDSDALAQKQNVHSDTLSFISETGNELTGLTMLEGELNAATAAISVASNASVANFGAPAAEAGVVLMLELAKAAIETRKQELQTAQQMRFEQANAEIEYIDGMANIKRQLVDVVQVGVEMQQSTLRIVETNAALRNAIAKAKLYFDNRQRALSLVDSDPSRDPAYRAVRDKSASDVLDARFAAQRELFLAGRALEYEINTPLSTLPAAVMNARTASQQSILRDCLNQVFDAWLESYSNPETYTHEVSVRELFGITGPRTDEVTGQELSEGEQFRLYVLRSANLDSSGSLTIHFSTNLEPGNGLWSTNVCNDRITGLQAQFVGDFQGDNEAQLEVTLSGAGVMRTCDTAELRSWVIDDAKIAEIQAGVNTYGEATPNTSLYGQSVARTNWEITIPGGDIAPTNSDLDISSIDDIVLKITHEASPLQAGSDGFAGLSCLSAGLP